MTAQAPATAPPGRVPAAVGVVMPPAGQSSHTKIWCWRCSSVRWKTVDAPLAAQPYLWRSAEIERTPSHSKSKGGTSTPFMRAKGAK
jgi:hypothetical protein